MRIDLYTKIILTLIAVLLAVFALKPILQPTAVMAQGNFAGIQFSYSAGNHAFFNANTGDVWEYGDHGNFRNHYRAHELVPNCKNKRSSTRNTVYPTLCRAGKRVGRFPIDRRLPTCPTGFCAVQ